MSHFCKQKESTSLMEGYFKTPENQSDQHIHGVSLASSQCYGNGDCFAHSEIHIVINSVVKKSKWLFPRESSTMLSKQ